MLDGFEVYIVLIEGLGCLMEVGILLDLAIESSVDAIALLRDFMPKGWRQE